MTFVNLLPYRHHHYLHSETAVYAAACPPAAFLPTQATWLLRTPPPHHSCPKLLEPAGNKTRHDTFSEMKWLV